MWINNVVKKKPGIKSGPTNLLLRIVKLIDSFIWMDFVLGLIFFYHRLAVSECTFITKQNAKFYLRELVSFR